jgi:hypothetical protein
MSWRPMPMKFPATCIVCNQKLKVGEMGLWAKGLGVKHEKYSKEIDIEIEEIKIPESFLKDLDVDLPLKIIKDESEIIRCQNLLIDNLQKNSLTHGTIGIGLQSREQIMKELQELVTKIDFMENLTKFRFKVRTIL